MAVEGVFKEALMIVQEAKNNPWTVLLVIVWVLLNHGFARLYEPFEFWAKRRREGMDSYFAQNLPANTDVQEAMRDLREAHYFQIATGIYAEDKIRKRLIKLHHVTAPEVTWHRIKRAMEYLEPDNGDSMRVVPFTLWHKFSKFMNGFVMWMFLLAAASGFVLLLLQAEKTNAQLATQVASIMVLFAMAMVAQVLNWPYYSAEIIREELILRKSKS